MTHPKSRFLRDTAGLAALFRAVRGMPVPSPDASIRLWVAADSTGEDAYSTAIVMLDGLARARRRCRVRVLATGPNADSIRRARRGVFGPDVREQMTGARLKRYFVPYAGGYRVADHVRELCVFAVHELGRRLPFVRLDAIVCPLPLWRWTKDERKRTLDVFHLALKPGGLLFGCGNAIGDSDARFARVGRDGHSFVRRECDGRGARVQSLLAARPGVA